jgi:hypothetical protein
MIDHLETRRPRAFDRPPAGSSHPAWTSLHSVANVVLGHDANHANCAKFEWSTSGFTSDVQ